MSKEQNSSNMKVIELPEELPIIEWLNEVYDSISNVIETKNVILGLLGPAAKLEKLYQYAPAMTRRQHYEGGPFLIDIGNGRWVSCSCPQESGDDLRLYTIPRVKCDCELGQDYEYSDRSRSEE